MLEFVRRNQILLTSGALLLASLVLVSVNARERRTADATTALLLEGMRPVQYGVTHLHQAVQRIWHRYLALVGQQRENEALRTRILELEQEAVRLAEVEQTNHRLRDMLGFRRTLHGHTQIAQVTGKDPLPWFHTFTIDKGAADGVRKGMAVLSPHGVVGVVETSSAHAARVLLLTDHNSGIDAVVQRSRARGIVEGAVGEGCVMKYLRQGEDVAVGDRVVTSGLDGVFPKGVVIGSVTRLSGPSRGLMQVAEIEPAVPFDRIEEVLIVDASATVDEGAR